MHKSTKPDSTSPVNIRSADRTTGILAASSGGFHPRSPRTQGSSANTQLQTALSLLARQIHFR
jgi:hypothetical protein